MNNQDQVPTIAELWKEAEFLIELTIPHLEGLANPKNRVNEERRPIYVEGLAKCKDKLESLRQQLVDRCASVSDREGCYTEFVIRGNTLKAVIYLPNNSRFSGSRKDDANSAREMGCAYLFWAWELEQREKEASNG